MDAVGYEQSVYQNIKKDYREFAQDLSFDDVRFVPISALRGDNVVNESEAMSWYPGSTLMKLLNTVQVNHAKNDEFRLQVQYVNRPNLDFRGFSGTVAAGDIRVGDTVSSLPSGKESKVKSIVTFDGDLEKASAGMAITLTLEDEIDVSRGDMLVRPHQKPHSADSFEADVVWMTEEALHVDREYEIKVGSKSVYGYAEVVNYKVDVNTLEQQEASQLNLNEIGNCQFALTAPVQFDAYDVNKHTGAFIIIDRLTNVTVGAGMIRKPLDGKANKPKSEYSAFEVEFNALVRKHFPHWDAKAIR
jgi:sulfate adenylyltransferase subunit 1